METTLILPLYPQSYLSLVVQYKIDTLIYQGVIHLYFHKCLFVSLIDGK